MRQLTRRSNLNQTIMPDSTQSEMKSESHPFRIQHIKLDNPEYKDEVPEHLNNKFIPGFPTTVVAVGKPGCGKTNVLMNFLTREELWNKFYDKIYLLGPTVKSDKLFKKIEVPKNQQVTDPGEFISKLVEWTEAQVHKVENNPNDAPKCLFIFEDITSYRNTVQLDPNFTKCFTTIRHHKSTAYANIHKYCSLERTARMSAMHIILFPVNRTEIDAVYADFGTDDFEKNDFPYICKYAWTPTEENKKPFLYINLYVEQGERFRKCFEEVINVSAFSGHHHHARQLKRQALKGVDSKGKKLEGNIPKMQPQSQLKPEKAESKIEAPTPQEKTGEGVQSRAVDDNPMAYLV